MPRSYGLIFFPYNYCNFYIKHLGFVGYQQKTNLNFFPLCPFKLELEEMSDPTLGMNHDFSVHYQIIKGTQHTLALDCFSLVIINVW